MVSKLSATSILLALSMAGLSPAVGAAQSATTNLGSNQADSKALNRLQTAAQRLRDAVQQLAQQQPGDRRNYAIKQANEALLEVKQAMVSLPPEYRSKDAPATGSTSRRVPAGTAGTADQGQAVETLQQAAQRLRESVQAMATEPAGERRNNAIKAANEALFDTQDALAAAIGPNRSGKGAGAGATRGTGGAGTVGGGEMDRGGTRPARAARG